MAILKEGCLKYKALFENGRVAEAAMLFLVPVVLLPVAEVEGKLKAQSLRSHTVGK